MKEKSRKDRTDDHYDDDDDDGVSVCVFRCTVQTRRTESITRSQMALETWVSSPLRFEISVTFLLRRPVSFFFQEQH